MPIADRTADDVVETPADAAATRPSRKKLLLLASGVLLVLLLIAGGVLFFTGAVGKLFGRLEAENPAVAKAAPAAVFYDLPDLLVNLNTNSRKASFLKLSVSLELEHADDLPRLQAVMPLIIDNFQVYLRELRVDDLRGSGGIYRLREELLSRVNSAAAPVKVVDVLFKEMLVQ